MDLKTAFLNCELDEEVYMNQPQGFIFPSNENKVYKMIKSLYGLKHAPKQWHQKFHEVVLSNGYLLNQADKCVDLTKEFLSLRFSMKDMVEVDVILGIRIKHESNGIAISQSRHIENVLKKFNYFDCTPVSTPMDTSKKLMPNNGQAVSQLKYSRVIGCLMYAMTCRRPDIAFVIVARKEAEWLRNLILEISLWSKPISPIFICCDSAATLPKAYNQMYNEKSRHLGVRHSMIRELITNGVISIEFVRS
nr:zinc finger, CCHC-type [Tanacetum cinerariifolium]